MTHSHQMAWIGKTNKNVEKQIELLKKNHVSVDFYQSSNELNKNSYNSHYQFYVMSELAVVDSWLSSNLILTPINSHIDFVIMIIIDLASQLDKDACFIAGATEVLVSPSDTELIARITDNQKKLIEAERVSLQLSEASQMALLAMTNASDLGSIISFTQDAVLADNYSLLADAVLKFLEPFCDNAVVEISGLKQKHYFGINGVVDPDLKKFLLQEQSNERIVHYEDLILLNHNNLALIVAGLPVNETEKIGRILDNLATFLNLADSFALSKIRSEQLANIEQTKRHFLAVLGHELRTPMNAIHGFSKILINKHEHEILGERGTDLLRRINTGSKKISAFIDTALDIERMSESSTGESEQALVQVEDLFDKLEGRLQEQACKRKNKLIFNHDNCNEFSGDAVRTEMMLYHLVDNAIKFTENGAVKISVDELLQDTEYQVCFTVKDNGIGISDTDKQHLFSIVNDTQGVNTKENTGIGLGLFYVRLACELLKGHIDVQSEVGEGSNFLLFLP